MKRIGIASQSKAAEMPALGGWRRACALVVVCAAAATVAPAQTFTTVATFNGTNGSTPLGGVAEGPDGNLYGTTSSGGSAEFGTVFELGPTGLSTLYTFTSLDGYGTSELSLGTDVNGVENFYGTTQDGAAGEGTLFQISPAGELTTLYADLGGLPAPSTGVTQTRFSASEGGPLGLSPIYYATTYSGGTGPCFTGCGTIARGFEGTLMIAPLASFSFDGNNGSNPEGSLIQGFDGHWYGTTSLGGSSNYGTVFKFIEGSGTIQTLTNFDYNDGANPAGGLVEAPDGTFFGTTELGGDGSGTVFRLFPDGSLQLHNFDGPDGAYPTGDLILGTDGNIYGITSGGGNQSCFNGCGTIFQYIRSGGFAVLHNFDGTDGNAPTGRLFQATDGMLYGTTSEGGPDNDGTVFSLDLGLGPVVKTLPTQGSIGQGVYILGTDLTGATSVTFNGTPASFTVNSANQISTSVPAGATSGIIQVTTPGGVLPSVYFNIYK